MKLPIYLSILIVLLFVVNGCSVFKTPPSAQSTTESLEPPPLSAIDLAKIQTFTSAAEEALEKNHLTSPADANAYFYFQQILKVDAANEVAKRGIETVAERLIDRALQAMNRNNPGAAGFYLDTAKIVDPKHLGIEPIARQVKWLKNSKANRYSLAKKALSARSEVIRQRLLRIGREAEAKKARVNIVARNDAEGRWVYQQLREGVNSFLIRGDIKIGSVPSVELRFVDCVELPSFC